MAGKNPLLQPFGPEFYFILCVINWVSLMNAKCWGSSGMIYNNDFIYYC